MRVLSFGGAGGTLRLQAAAAALAVVLGAGAAVGALGLGWPGTVRACAALGLWLAMTAPWLDRHPHATLGWGSGITGLRGVLVAVLAAALGTRALPWLALGSLAGVGFVLDAVDGHVARRRGTASAFGARLDAELDAVTMLVLAALVWDLERAGAWVLVAGGLRYGFALGGQVFPWLAAPLPPWPARAHACGVAVTCLCLALIPSPLAPLLALAAVAVLCASFGADAAWLWSRR